MDFDFDECTRILHKGLVSGLAARGDQIRNLHATEPLRAVSYDVVPWHPRLSVSFRLESESNWGASANFADWKHDYFVGETDSESLVEARRYIEAAYKQGEGDTGTRCQEIAHLIFLSAAHALLAEDVAVTLRSFGIDAPHICDTMPWYGFHYFVTDPDGVIKANYCDIVCANRVTQRLIGRVMR
jgi:hypothetical protein